ncbi:MAG: hypothetical protein JRF59_13980 [Deltaproteobacteria bacterium]|nr:hypothetical protein [Deltaproteobacteria bacterium]MBW1924435.1 hypothetical protein [Deltaproteobacteria bacterium]MBW1950584.1 hypothetical protein [Deltaproteobacteria bacterium]MBW2007583.1 hypothetical protein [Deltaproteobacteria bacterium]MBW2101952.1 hypothetical protein [Deltaproteobacteria bacterium]
MKCAFCRKELQVNERVARTDTCPHCGRDLRCCRQCKFYDTHAYNSCREVSAERVVDKERANFCEYYLPRGSARKNVNRTEDAKKALEALFKKA